ncbi:MAG: PilN domain-containing protein [Alphaproteobacteria bacterium]|nr:PilN domain-containing protein [Alphaproteobacteria bacterium]
MASDVIREGFDQLSGRVRDAFVWWTGEFTDMAPRGFRSRRSRASGSFTLLIDQQEIALLEGADETTKERGRADLADDAAMSDLLSRCRGRAAVSLHLASGQGLRNRIELPLAARRDLDQALGFELDRLTPFSADEVWFESEILGVDRNAGRMTVALDLAPKEAILPVIALAERNGLSVERVEIEGQPDRPPLDLLAAARRREARSDRPSRRRRLLPAIAAVLAAIVISTPLLRQEMALAALERKIEALRPAAETSTRLRARQDKLIAERGFLADTKSVRPTMTELLAELTRLIPDQAHILQLEIHEDSLDLYGLTDNASGLIGILDGSPLFEAPVFEAPITKDARAHKERFQIGLRRTGGDV